MGKGESTLPLDDEFLLLEGLDLLATYRSIKCKDARRSVMAVIAAIVQAESEGKTLSISFEPSGQTTPARLQ